MASSIEWFLSKTAAMSSASISTPKSHLPTQTDILEDDPLEGDSSYLLRYGDWRKVDQS